VQSPDKGVDSSSESDPGTPHSKDAFDLSSFSPLQSWKHRVWSLMPFASAQNRHIRLRPEETSCAQVAQSPEKLASAEQKVADDLLSDGSSTRPPSSISSRSALRSMAQQPFDDCSAPEVGRPLERLDLPSLPSPPRTPPLSSAPDSVCLTRHLTPPRTRGRHLIERQGDAATSVSVSGANQAQLLVPPPRLSSLNLPQLPPGVEASARAANNVRNPSWSPPRSAQQAATAVSTAATGSSPVAVVAPPPDEWWRDAFAGAGSGQEAQASTTPRQARPGASGSESELRRSGPGRPGTNGSAVVEGSTRRRPVGHQTQPPPRWSRLGPESLN